MSGNLVVLARQAQDFPAAWASICEEIGWPPTRVDTWQALAALDSMPEAVVVTPGLVDAGRPADESWRRSAVRWVALVEQIDFQRYQELRHAGYDEVLTLDMAPALLLGPLHRVEELRVASEARQRLLDESLAAYEDIRWLDRIRERMRLVEPIEMAPSLIRLVAEALGEQGGCLWRPDSADGRPGGFAVECTVDAEPPAVEKLELHAMPQVQELLAGHPVVMSRERPGVWVPLLDGGMLIALVEIPRGERRPGKLLHREIARLRMLVDWLGIALRNGIEIEQMRTVLRARFGDFFSADAFTQHVDKALVQARRYRRPLGVVGLVWLGPAAERERFFRAVFELLRDADVFEQPTGDRARIFLPETGYLGGVQFLRRIRRELAQKFGLRWPAPFQGAVVAFPWAGEDGTSLLAAVDHELDRASKLDATLRKLRSSPMATLPDILAPWSNVETLDPNVWADLVFHLVQEVTLQHPDDSRLLLYLGAHRDSTRTFAPLFEFPARWDRILVAAGLDTQGEPQESHLVRLVRDEHMLQRWYAVFDRPGGALVAWSACDDGNWRGGVCTEPQLAQVALNRFEDQYMLHHRWVAS